MSETWRADHGDCAIEADLRDGALHVALSRGGASLRSSGPLRLVTSEGVDLLTGLTAVSTATRAVTESYDVAVGKRIGHHDAEHVERTVDLVRRDGGRLSLVLRAAQDGVALRLVLRTVGGVQVSGADLSLDLPPAAPLWPLRYTPWYEEPRFTATVAGLAEGDYGLPLLAQVDAADESSYVLISESDVDGRYGGSYLHHQDGTFAFTLADPVELGAGEVATPWRVFVLGDLAQVVASHLVDDLAPAASGPVPAWVRPGRAAWSWWSDFSSGAQLAAQLRLVDYAAEHGWEHVLVDCGWDRAWIPELVAAASARGVGIFLWISWDWLDIATDLAEWASWGVAGIKVDFMESESQERYRWYDAVIAETARVGLMVNFHGSVIPRGWARTHPHVVAYEAVRGAEYYVFYQDVLPPEHNTIVPFTRNVVGSADYTPVTFSTPVRATSDAHELALAVVLESWITHFADEISEYLARPLAQLVLDRVSAAWDETRLLGGRPGEWVALARRRRDEWFVGVISAGPPRTVDLDLGGLFAGAVQLVTDGPGGGLRTAQVDADRGRVRLDLHADGGAVLLTAGEPPAAPAPPAAAARMERTVLVDEPGATVRVAVQPAQGTTDLELVPPPGWPRPRAVGPGVWEVTIPTQTAPAHVAVLSVRRTDDSRRSAVTHVRVVTRPAPGATGLVDVRPVSARNGFGPVERNMSNGGGNPFDGSPLTIAGTVHARGLGVCAPAEVGFAPGGVADRFTALVGIDDETPEGATATVEVIGDGASLLRLELQAGQPARSIDLDVHGVDLLDLLVIGPVPTDGPSPAHVDWVDPQLHRSPPTGRTAP